MEQKNSIIVLDFGGQYAHLIASKIRRLGAAACIAPAETRAEALRGAAGIILSGGPQSVYEEGSPQADKGIFSLGIPILGLCYGHQWMARALGGAVGPGAVKEYGRTDVRLTSAECDTASLFAGITEHFTVWMSHGDEVKSLPEGCTVAASTKHCAIAAMQNPSKRLYGIQWHIEVAHSEFGAEVLRRFSALCRPAPWSMKGYAARIASDIQRSVGCKNVFMLVSGGVDSTVAFTLLNSVLGQEHVKGLLIDTGLMRKNEVRNILDAFKPLGITNLHTVDASEEFFAALKGVAEPEAKRRIIGETFLAVQRLVSDEMGLRIEDGWMLGQGTIYPDTIETGGTKHADTIKTHHNRVPRVQAMIDRGLVIEPLKDLYKDEVRALGEELGLPRDLVWKHPFPGPGLGVRILCTSETAAHAETGLVAGSLVLPVQSVGVQGDGRTYRTALALFSEDPLEISEHHWSLATQVPNEHRSINRVLKCLSQRAPFTTHMSPTFLTRETATLLQEADAIVDDDMRTAGLTARIWQFPVVLLPFGASPGKRSIVLRPISSTDAMTAHAFSLPRDVLERMTRRLLGVPGIDAVFIDLTSKPPGTIEWE